MKRLAIAALTLLLAAPALRADDNALERDQVAAFKKTLVAVFDALGKPPEGFAKDHEDYDLPTNYTKDDKGRFDAVYANAERRFGIKAVKDAETKNKQLGTDYQKKMLEAQAKGDYQEVARLAQEVQKQASTNQLEAVTAQEQKKEPIEVRVQLNSTNDQTIDPDNVLAEHPGFIALKSKSGDSEVKENVDLYFQPTLLKDTKKLSKVSLMNDARAVTSLTSVVAIQVHLEGPNADVEAWAKRADYKKILALVTATAQK